MCGGNGWLQPGLTGGSDDTYVRHMLIRARSRGWRVVVFNSRGCGNSPVITPQVGVLLLDSMDFCDALSLEIYVYMFHPVCSEQIGVVK